VLIDLPTPWLVAANLIGCPLLQYGLAAFYTALPAARFSDEPTEAPLSQLDLYENHFRVKEWKDRLPDGASWFSGGFPKASLEAKDPAYLRRFLAETRRGERCHWVAILLSTVFMLWNPWWAWLIVFTWFLVSNLPCILVQRYNRLRFSRTLRRFEDAAQS